ncbi:MAG: cell division protein FtsL [Betaproteobacteria bacterium]|nr:cell division protein FtsL [Betaproteobacteria bacterium]
MLRLNMLLMLFSVFCALATVTSQHKARQLFQALELEQERARQLDIEFGQLQLELSTWAAHPRIEQIARERLKMRVPDPAHIIIARSGTPGNAP